jgi:hypothetical protein
MISGVPWDPLPDHVHVFDLTPGQIRQSAPNTAAIRQWRRAQRELSEEDILPLLHGASHAIIRRFGPRAVFNPVVQAALFYWLTFAQYASTKTEAEYAAFGADALLDAFRANLSRRVERTPTRLASIQKTFAELLTRARTFKTLQESQHGQAALLAKARWFDPVSPQRCASLDISECDGYRDGSPRNRHGVFRKTLRDMRGLAEKQTPSVRPGGDLSITLRPARDGSAPHIGCAPTVRSPV